MTAEFFQQFRTGGNRIKQRKTLYAAATSLCTFPSSEMTKQGFPNRSVTRTPRCRSPLGCQALPETMITRGVKQRGILFHLRNGFLQSPPPRAAVPHYRRRFPRPKGLLPPHNRTSEAVPHALRAHTAGGVDPRYRRKCQRCAVAVFALPEQLANNASTPGRTPGTKVSAPPLQSPCFLPIGALHLLRCPTPPNRRIPLKPLPWSPSSSAMSSFQHYACAGKTLKGLRSSFR